MVERICIMEKKMYKYDVAVSYESGSEKYVEEVVKYLTIEGLKVYFAPDRQDEMLSEELEAKLYQVYQNESWVDVIFITKNYLNSPFTLLEKRCALRNARKNRKRLIVVNFMGNDIPDDLKKYVYIDGSSEPDEVAYEISTRIRQLTEPENVKRSSDKEKHREKNGQKKIVNCHFGSGNLTVAEKISIGTINNYRGGQDGRK